MRSGPTTPPSTSFSTDTLVRSVLVTNAKLSVPPSTACVRSPLAAMAPAAAVPFLSDDAANDPRLTVHFGPPWQLLHLPVMNCWRPAVTSALLSVVGALLGRIVLLNASSLSQSCST